MSRDQEVAWALVGLADTYSEDFDPVALFRRLVGQCVSLLEVDAAAVMVADGRGNLRTMAASEEEAAFVEMLQLQTGAGPCMDSYRSGDVVSVPDIATEARRWPKLVPAARRVGYESLHALPLRLHSHVLGAVNLFRAAPGELSEDDEQVGQALADVTVLALMTWTSDRVPDSDVVTRVQGAIAAKAALEMAKGMVAQYAGVSMAQAATILYAYAENRRTRLTDTALRLLDGALDLGAVLRTVASSPAEFSPGS